MSRLWKIKKLFSEKIKFELTVHTMTAVRPINKELAKKAKEELNEVENRIPDDITALREWIQKQPHLNARTDDQFLIAFLRCCKYSLEKAKERVDLFYTCRSVSPDLFLNKQIGDKTIRLAKQGSFLPLPKSLHPDGPSVYLIRFGHLNSNDFSGFDVLQIHLRILDIESLENDNLIIGGFENIVDLKNMSLGDMFQYDIMLVKKICFFIINAVPFHLKNVHIINYPKEATHFINLVMSAMPKRIKEKIIIHSSLENLYKHVPKEYLPEEYGGHNGTLQGLTERWEERLLEYKAFFEDDMQYKVNESLRVGARESIESFVGLDGSFRKLDID